MEICDRCGKLKASHRGGLCYPDTAPSSREEFVPSGRFPEPSAPPVAVPAPTEPSGATELPKLEVKRFDPSMDEADLFVVMDQYKDGHYVQYSDFQALQAKYEAALRENAELRSRLVTE